MARFQLSLGPGVIDGPKIEDVGDEFIIRDVLVMTAGPARGHFLQVGEGEAAKELPVIVDATTLTGINAAAAKYAHGVKSKADHESGIRQVIGYFTDFRMGTDKTGAPASRADYHLLKSTTGIDHLLNLFKKLADTIGFSAIFDGKPEIKEKMALARCEDLFSVDLVTDPAANPAGVFSAKVDKSRVGDPDHNMPDEHKQMSPEEFASACMAALKPHLDQIHSRLGHLETRGMPTAQTSMAAQSGAVGPTSEDDMYMRFSAKIKGEVKSLVAEEMQATAKTLHALGLRVGDGPGASTAGDGRGTGAKKVEDMTFSEVLALEFSKAENEAKPDSQIVREVTMQYPEKHRTALAARQLNTLPRRTHPYRPAARR